MKTSPCDLKLLPKRKGIDYRRVMPQMRRKFDAEFREGAVRLVREAGKPIARLLVILV
jgi:transposase-like protein